MIHEQNIEYRQLNILRAGLLRGLEESGGTVSRGKFCKMLKSVMRNLSRELESLFIQQVSGEDGTISYQKICDIINLYQYHLHFVQ